MSKILGIDTSNYTTSACLYDSESDCVSSFGRLLSVKQGELGLRQSDAVFEHVKQFFDVFSKIESSTLKDISAVAVSTKPRAGENSYMPCFLVGKTVASSIAHTLDIPLYEFTHQEGHIMAALYSADKRDLIGKDFLTFHVSGGTTDLIKVGKGENSAFTCNLVGGSSDLKMGQAVDRLGLALGMPFPSGKYLDELATHGEKTVPFSTRVNGLECSISGFENQFKKMIDDGISSENIAYSFFCGLAKVLYKLSVNARSEYGNLPIIFSGGVMSNSIIKSELVKQLKNVYFAEPRFSSDNAAGISVLGYLRSVGEI